METKMNWKHKFSSGWWKK